MADDLEWFMEQVGREQSRLRAFVRNFVGRLDGLAILDRVLPPEEIAQWYGAGKP